LRVVLEFRVRSGKEEDMRRLAEELEWLIPALRETQEMVEGIHGDAFLAEEAKRLEATVRNGVAKLVWVIAGMSFIEGFRVIEEEAEKKGAGEGAGIPHSLPH